MCFTRQIYCNKGVLRLWESRMALAYINLQTGLVLPLYDNTQRKKERSPKSKRRIRQSSENKNASYHCKKNGIRKGTRAVYNYIYGKKDGRRTFHRILQIWQVRKGLYHHKEARQPLEESLKSTLRLPLPQ